MLLVYTAKITNRIRYIFESYFKDRLGIDVDFTIEKDMFVDYEGAKLNYSSRRFNEELFFCAAPLLFERGIKKQKIKVDDFEDTKMFFINRSNSDLPFDPFSRILPDKPLRRIFASC